MPVGGGWTFCVRIRGFIATAMCENHSTPDFAPNLPRRDEATPDG